jgi:hypothetical protein
MAKVITKKESELFNNKIEYLIKAAEIFNLVETGYQRGWAGLTKVGNLEISLYPQHGSEVYSVFTRFNNPKMASTLFSCNPHTGKCNIHEFIPDEGLLKFEEFLINLGLIKEC